jgi:hypothetical protein
VFTPVVNEFLKLDGLSKLGVGNAISLFFVTIGLSISIIGFVEAEKYLVAKRAHPHVISNL